MALDLQLASLDFTGRDAALRGTLPATSSSPKEPSGALVGTSSSGANWLTVLSEPFNRYFLGKDIQREREFQLQLQAQEGTVNRDVAAIRSKNYLIIGAVILGAAVLLGVLKRG